MHRFHRLGGKGDRKAKAAKTQAEPKDQPAEDKPVASWHGLKLHILRVKKQKQPLPPPPEIYNPKISSPFPVRPHQIDPFMDTASRLREAADIYQRQIIHTVKPGEAQAAKPSIPEVPSQERPTSDTPTAHEGQDSISERSEWIELCESEGSFYSNDGEEENGPDKCLFSSRPDFALRGVKSARRPRAYEMESVVAQSEPPAVVYDSQYRTPSVRGKLFGSRSAQRPIPRSIPLDNYIPRYAVPTMTGGFLQPPAQEPAQLSPRDNLQVPDGPSVFRSSVHVNWRFNQFGERVPVPLSTAPLGQSPLGQAPFSQAPPSQASLSRGHLEANKVKRSTTNRQRRRLPRPESYAGLVPDSAELDKRDTRFPDFAPSSARRPGLVPRFSKQNNEGLGIHVHHQDHRQDATAANDHPNSTQAFTKSARSTWETTSTLNHNGATASDTPAITLDTPQTVWNSPASAPTPFDPAPAAPRRSRGITRQWTQSRLMEGLMHLLDGPDGEEISSEALAQRIEELKAGGLLVSRPLPETLRQSLAEADTIPQTHLRGGHRYSVLSVGSFDFSSLEEDQIAEQVAAESAHDYDTEHFAAEPAYDHDTEHFAAEPAYDHDTEHFAAGPAYDHDTEHFAAGPAYDHDTEHFAAEPAYDYDIEHVAAEHPYNHVGLKRRSIFALLPRVNQVHGSSASSSAQPHGDDHDDEEEEWFALVVHEDHTEDEGADDEAEDTNEAEVPNETEAADEAEAAEEAAGAENEAERLADVNRFLSAEQEEPPRAPSAMSTIRFDSGVAVESEIAGLEDVASPGETIYNPTFLARVLDHVPDWDLPILRRVSPLWNEVIMCDAELWARCSRTG